MSANFPSREPEKNGENELTSSSISSSPEYRVEQLVNDGKIDEARREVHNIIFKGDLDIGSVLGYYRRGFNDTIGTPETYYWTNIEKLEPIFNKMRNLRLEIERNKDFDVIDALDRYEKIMQEYFDDFDGGK